MTQFVLCSEAKQRWWVKFSHWVLLLCQQDLGIHLPLVNEFPGFLFFFAPFSSRDVKENIELNMAELVDFPGKVCKLVCMCTVQLLLMFECFFPFLC